MDGGEAGANRAERVGRNEALFRDVNERLRNLNETFAEITGTWEVVCECVETTCAQPVVLSAGEYEAVRAVAERFIVSPGHVERGVERVIQQNERYAVVEKLGDAGEVARRTDPRSD